MPQLYLIAGPNGAGKSTIGKALLPETAQSLPVFDGDVVYHATLREAFARLQVAKLAHREAMEATLARFEELVEDALGRRADFAYEGHFNGAGPWQTIQRFKDAGYTVHLVFLGLSSPELSLARVANRVEEGGHYVAPPHVRENYEGNLAYLNDRFRVLDTLRLFDVSSARPELLLHWSGGRILERSPTQPGWFRAQLPALNGVVNQSVNKPVRGLNRG